MGELRALSVWNPWAWALVAGHKPVENRDWPLPSWMRGAVCLIHSGAHKPTQQEIATVRDWADEHQVEVPPWALRPGRGIVGALVFDGDVPPEQVPRGAEWAFGSRCWTVRQGSAVVFPEPIPCKGALGFFWPSNGHSDHRCVEAVARRMLAGKPATLPRPTEAELRRRVERALHETTGSMETWRLIPAAMDRHLGPALGMTPRERWDQLGVYELELLADALEERAAMVAEGKAAC